jgi:hypothetical protein
LCIICHVITMERCKMSKTEANVLRLWSSGRFPTCRAGNFTLDAASSLDLRLSRGSQAHLE